MQGKELAHTLKLANKVIIPVQPSVFDMVATRDFINRLVEERTIQKEKILYWYSRYESGSAYSRRSTLKQFLLQYDLPIITYLRDTKLYVNAAFNGKSILIYLSIRLSRN